MATASIYMLLQQKLEDLKGLQIIDRHHKTTKKALNDALKESQRLEKQLDKENADIEKLEKMSIKKLFHKVLGNAEKQLEIERQEFLELSLKFNEHKKSIELMEFELGVLEGKKEGIPELRKEIKKFKKLREKEILSSDSRKAKKLRSIIEENDYLILGKKEYQEAIVVGEDILKHLVVVIGHLRKAENWGTYKNIGGRGRMSSYNQRGAIENARSIIIRTQHLMRIFKKELQDINVHDFDTRLSADQLSGFTNIFFDNLITDWIIQKKIKNTLAEVRSVHDRIKRFMGYLIAEFKKMDQRVNQLNAERDQLIVSK